jgi:AcrR family transcriptional regulator
MPTVSPRTPALPREERRGLVLDAAADLFYARGVHEVGMDELVGASGLGKATVYRMFGSKDELIGAYLQRSAAATLGSIDVEIARHEGDPAGAIAAIFEAIAEDVARPAFRGCAFNNASIEFSDPQHPARIAARDYRAALHARLTELSTRLSPDSGERVGAELALVVDGMYTNAAHLGPGGPAAAGPGLAAALVAARHG